MTAPVAGSLAKFWLQVESAYDTHEAWAATDGLGLKSCEIEPSLKYNKVHNHLGSLSLLKEVEGKRGGKWSLKSYVDPAAAGTAPDIGELLKHALGTETVSGGTSVTYSLADTTPSSLALRRASGTDFSESAWGMWCEELGIEIKGGSEPEITASGGFARYSCLYPGATVSGAHTTPDTTIQLASGDAGRVRPGAYIGFGAETNGGAGYLVTAVDYATDIITISPTLANNVAGGTAVVNVVPAHTLSGAGVVGGIACGLSIGGTSVGVISASVQIKTGIKALDDEATSDRASRIVRAPYREITGEFEVYFLTENDLMIGKAWNGTQQALILRAGANTAGARMKVNAPYARLEVTPIDLPEAEVAKAKIKFVARGSAGADELTIVFD